MWRRKLVGVVGLLLLLAGGVTLGFGPLVRSRIAARAERYGAEVTVERVEPIWLGVRLHGVGVRLADLPTSSVRLETVTVELDRSGATRQVEVAGGMVRAQGSVEELKGQLKALRERGPAGQGGGGAGTPVRVAGVGLEWSHGADKVGVAQGAIERSAEGWRAQAQSVQATRGGQSATVEQVAVELVRSEQGLRLGGWKAEQLEADVTLLPESAEEARGATGTGGPGATSGQGGGSGAGAAGVGSGPGAGVGSNPGASAPVAGQGGAEGAKEPGGTKGKSRRGRRGAGEESAAERSAGKVAERPAAGTVGARVAEAGGRLRERAAGAKAKAHQLAQMATLGLAEGASIAVNRLRVTVHRGQEKLHVGPGALTVQARSGVVSVSLAPLQAAAGGAPLLLSAEIPVDARQELAMRASGGPVTLAMLGVQERDMGLLDVGKATVEVGGVVKLSGAGEHVEVDVQGQVRGLSLEHPKLSTEPVRGLDLRFAWAGGGETDGSSVRVDRGELDVGKVHGEVSGTLTQQGDAQRIQGKFAVPLASCQSLSEALPAGLAPKLAGVRMSGTFAVNGRVDFDSRKPDEALVDFTLLNDCRLVNPGPEVNVARFRQPFRRKVYTPDNKLVEVESGPGTPGWTSFAGITPFMEAAVLTTEDGGFRRHRGFDMEAIRNSIRENLKAGRFVRGASTISMQTAKNVYLTREKTLGRKLQEALLTMYLEQELSKEQILELYLNCIEFGPMIYGIGPAAQHYFNTTPGELSLGQALYLASILPNPKRQHFAGDNRVTPGHMGYLHRLMRMMVKRNLIREDEMQEGLGEWVVFGQAKVPREKGDSLEEMEREMAPR